MIVEDVHATGMAEACPVARMDGYFTPPEALLGADGRLSDTVLSALVRGDARHTLAHAAVFKLAELGRLSVPGIDRARAGLLANAVADLSVSGALGHASFLRAVTSDGGEVPRQRLSLRVTGFMSLAAGRLGTTVPGSLLSAENQEAVRLVIDRALAVLWALHGPTGHRIAHRPALGWIAVSPEQDPPPRPVNVPGTRWPTRDLTVSVAHHGRETRCRTRYAIAGARDFSSSSPTSGLLPRLDAPPVLDPDADVVIFIHGHSSRLEEADTLFDALTAERSACSPRGLALISFDMPTHGYSEYLDHEAISPLRETRFVPDHPEDRRFGILEFFEAFVVAFVESLDAEMKRAGQPGILHRVAAVIGGSFGGNLGLRLSERLVTNPAWLKAVVAWSPACAPPSLGRADLFIPSPGEHVDPIAKQALDRTRDRCDDAENSNSRAGFFRAVLSGERLINEGTPGFEAATRFLGFLAGPLVEWAFPLGPFAVFGASIVTEAVASVVVQRQSDEWLRPECRAGFDSRVRASTALLSLAETYCSERRRMHWRVAYEQLLFSHQDEIIASRGRPCFEVAEVPLLLIAGADDNTNRYEIFNSVRSFAPRMTATPGRALLVRNTGHSIHDERPRWLARRIHDFLCEQRRRFTPPRQLVVAPDFSGTAGNDLWAMRFAPAEGRWSHVSPIPGHGFGADLNCDLGVAHPTAFGVRFALAGDFDGDGEQELVVAPDVPGTAGNDFWVMKFDPAARRWNHLSPIPGHGFGADLNCDLGLPTPTAFGVKFALAGDFDGDGRQELVVAPDVPGTGGNDFWVMKFDPAARRWSHLSPIPGHSFGADLNCDLGLSRPTAFGVKFALAGDFDGDGQQELVVAPDVPGTGGQRLLGNEVRSGVAALEPSEPHPGSQLRR